MFDGFWWILMDYVWGARSGECSYKVYTLCFQTYIYIRWNMHFRPQSTVHFFKSYMNNILNMFSGSWRWCSNSLKMEDLKQLLLMISRLLGQNLRRTRIRRFLGEIQADLCRFVTGKRVCHPWWLYIYTQYIKENSINPVNNVYIIIQLYIYIYIYYYFILSKYQGIVRNMRKNVNPRFCVPWFDQRLFSCSIEAHSIGPEKTWRTPQCF